MTKFIQNINAYIGHYKIKQNFIAMKSGIEKNKFSRIINGKQDVMLEDMEKIAESLGKEVGYFMQENLIFNKAVYEETTSIAFYMGAVDDEKRKLANQVFDFLENIDAILGVQKKIDRQNSLHMTEIEVMNHGF